MTEIAVTHVLEVNRSDCGQTNSAGLHGPGKRKRRSRTGPDECDTTLVQGPETDERDVSGGKSSICAGGGVFKLPGYLYWWRSLVKAGAAVCGVWIFNR